ncbi:YIP1 family protein [Pseudodesulfovibrio sp.]|uniref:YIP1 family protein n=1 Tax=unclassified Pseudodesulfovibrio TaxID=2661612 RepID=UPI003B00DB61
MQIICPECQFAREVDETKIPPRSQVATCPKCHTKFKFRELPEEDVPSDQNAEQPVTRQPRPETVSDSDKDSQSSAPRHGSPQNSEKRPAAQRPVRRPDPQNDEESAFPNLPAPEETSNEGLWDRLDRMAPPEKNIPSSRNTSPTPPSAPQDQEPIPGWTGEFNDDFPDPMIADDKNDKEQDNGMQVPPPFEQLDRYGFFYGLFLTIKLILLSPRLFFTVMPVGGGLAKPLTFTILVTMIQSFAQYIWGIAGLSASVSGENAAVSGMSTTMTALAMLLLLPALITVAQFVLTGIYHVLLIAMKADNKGFEGTFRALVYSNAPIVLGIFPIPNQTIDFVWMTIVAVWGLVLTIVGLKCIHRTSYSKVIPVAIIPLLLGMIAYLSLLHMQVATI